MKALVKTKIGNGNIEVQEVKEPEPSSNQVKIKVAYAGICGTDIHIYKGEFNCNPPVILGHEFSGVIVELGDKVSNLKKGDHVTAETAYSSCNVCIYCKEGNYNLCEYRKGIGYGTDGAFADYIVIDEQKVHKLPDNLSLEEGALCEPLAVAVHSLLDCNNINVQDLVVISGPGMIGLMCLQIAKIAGARCVVSGLSEDKARLEKAKSLFADCIVEADKESISEVIKKLNDQGADTYIECSGAVNSLKTGFDVLKKKGLLLQVGLFGNPVSIDYDQVALKELIVKGYFSHNCFSWKKAIKILSEKCLFVDSFISEKLPLSQWEKGFKSFEEKKGIKILLYPD